MESDCRCVAHLRGFAAGRCEVRGSVRLDGKWYCGRHDPTPKAVGGEPSYVWEVWNTLLFSHPHVKRYTLVKRNPKSGPTVLVRGKRCVLRVSTGTRYFYDEAALRDHLAAWLDGQVDRARRRLDALAADRDKPFSGVPITEVRDAPYAPVENLKLD